MYKRYRKRKYNKTFGIIIIFIGLIVFNLLEKDIFKKEEYYKTTTGLNVRTGVGKKYPISFTLKQGDEVKILAKNGSWYEISHNEKSGYAHSEYIAKSQRSVFDIQLFTPQLQRNVFISIALVLLFTFFLPLGLKKYRREKDNKLLKSITELNRGTATERDLVLVLLKNGKSAEDVYHDLYLKTTDDRFSQIDLVLITEIGIIVFEVKDYNGWLYGKGRQEQWTMISGKNKYRIYNPIIQNEVHVKNLRNIINENQDIPIFSVIVFYGNCNFKNINFVPQQTFLTTSSKVLEVIQTIEAINPIYVYNNLAKIRRILQEAKANGGIIENQELHIANIKDMLGTDRKFD